MDHYNKRHISYLAQLTRQLHSFDLDYKKKPKNIQVMEQHPKLWFFTIDAYWTFHIAISSTF
jgi:hypothetical protein